MVALVAAEPSELGERVGEEIEALKRAITAGIVQSMAKGDDSSVIHFYDVIIGKVVCGESTDEKRVVFPETVTCSQCLAILREHEKNWRK